jgi:uncharacterized protein (TIGR00299 family) protein
MQTLAFDGRTGASGDMMLGALVAAGADPDVLAPVEAALPVTYRIGETTRNGIRATSVDVVLDADAVPADETERDRGGDEHTHGHHHDHDDGNAHEHHHDHDHQHAEGSGLTRSYAECQALVEGMALPDPIADDATAIFELLGRAEAAVHGTDLEETHFHEVGADDAIADIVGAALLLSDLDVDRFVTTPVSAGGGEVSMHHGVYPVPTPAVSYLAADADWQLVGGPLEAELLTPTGAAILAHVAEGVDSAPPLSVDVVGYGAGDRSFPERPNVLRATVGTEEGGLSRDAIRVLETNVDDATPEVLGGLFDRLAEAGARDVSIVPLTMKKSRSGHLVRVVVKPEHAQAVARRLAAETGTLGIRETAARHRWIADRSVETVAVQIDGKGHEVAVKIARDEEGSIYDVSTEYDAAAALAAETGVPAREIIRRAEAAFDRGD